MKQGPYHGRRGRLHRHGGIGKRYTMRKPPRRVRIAQKLKERAA